MHDWTGRALLAQDLGGNLRARKRASEVLAHQEEIARKVEPSKKFRPMIRGWTGKGILTQDLGGGWYGKLRADEVIAHQKELAERARQQQQRKRRK